MFRGNALFLKLKKCFAAQGYFFDSDKISDWFISESGRLYLMHRPSNTRFDRIPSPKKGFNGSSFIKKICDEFVVSERRERAAGTPRNDGRVTFNFGGRSSNNIIVGTPLSWYLKECDALHYEPNAEETSIPASSVPPESPGERGGTVDDSIDGFGRLFFDDVLESNMQIAAMPNVRDSDVAKAVEQLSRVDDQLSILQSQVRDIVATLS